MKTLLKNRYFLVGIILLVIGSGPLIITMAAAKLGMTADPNPNPIIFGIMAMFTFWPGIAFMGIGLFSHYKSRKDDI